jgi:beta-glucanase (GH16 family)
MSLLAGRRLYWSDEFDGPAGSPPDPRWWKHELGDGSDTGNPGWGNDELQHYTDRAANACHDGRGNLAIRATNENGGYKSARIITKGLFEFTFGRIEARARVPRGAGLWSAIWALGANIDQAPWPACGEIDLVENLGRQPRRIFGTLHCPGHSGDAGISGAHILSEDASNDFHIFAVEWGPQQIEWSLDGHPYFAVPSRDLGKAWVFDHPFYLLINLTVGGNLGGPVAPGTTFEDRFLIDYVRIYDANDPSIILGQPRVDV